MAITILICVSFFVLKQKFCFFACYLARPYHVYAHYMGFGGVIARIPEALGYDS